MNGIRPWKTWVSIGAVVIAGIIACGGIMTSICDDGSLQYRVKPCLLIVAMTSFSGIELKIPFTSGIIASDPAQDWLCSLRRPSGSSLALLSWKFFSFPFRRRAETDRLTTSVIMNRHMCAWKTAGLGLCALTLMFSCSRAFPGDKVMLSAWPEVRISDLCKPQPV